MANNKTEHKSSTEEISELLKLIVKKLDRTGDKLDKLVEDCAEIKKRVSTLETVIHNNYVEKTETNSSKDVEMNKQESEIQYRDSNGSSHQKRPVFSPQISDSLEFLDKSVTSDLSDETLDALGDTLIVTAGTVHKSDHDDIRRKNCVRTDRSKEKSHDSKALAPSKVLSVTKSSLISACPFPLDGLNDRIKSPDTFTNIKTTVMEIVSGTIGPNVVFVGSVYEGLNVGRPYEFDIQWQIEGAYHFKNGPKGTVMVYKNPSNEVVTPESVRTPLKHRLEQIFKNFHLPLGWKLFQNDVHKSIIVHKKGFQLGLVFQDDTGVLLDIIPYFTLPDEMVNGNDLLDKKSLGQVNGYYRFKRQELPSIPIHLVFDSTSWRVSTSMTELSILNLMNENFKKPYRVVKYLLNTFISDDEPVFASTYDQTKSLYGLGHMIPSYLIKNEFLKIILENHSHLQSIESLKVDSFIIKQIIGKLELVYPSQKMQSVRHFLLQNNDVKIMTYHKQAEEIARKLQRIKDLISSSATIRKQEYPLINYPPIDIPKFQT